MMMMMMMMRRNMTFINEILNAGKKINNLWCCLS